MTSQRPDQLRDFPQRRSFRCCLPPGQQVGTLGTGRGVTMVRLLNESVDGMAVWAERDPGVKADDVVWLSTTFGRFQARVVHISQIEPPARNRGPGSPGYRVGLEWLPEPAVRPAVVGSGGFFGS